MIKKDLLLDGEYYEGYCRNATLARWSSKHERFFHWREKFGMEFIEMIPHQEDAGPGKDYFEPRHKLREIPFDSNSI